MLLFSKKHNAIKINKILLLNHPLLNNNHKNNTVNNKQDKEITNNIKENSNLDNDKYDINFKNIKNNNFDIKTEIDKKYDFYNINIELIDFNNLSINDILAKYSKNDKKIKYSYIYAYLNSQNEKEKIWTDYIRKIKKKKNRDNAKKAFRKSCKKYFLDKNKRLCQKTEIIDCFDKNKKIITAIIILNDEINNVIEKLHIGLGHIEVNRLQYEIIGRGYFLNNITRDIYNYSKHYT